MIKESILTRYFVLFGLCAVMTGCEPDSESQTAEELPALKQTNLGLYVTAQEAYEKWEADPENVFVLDVRTPEEYIFVGHADMAWNIPLAFQTYNWDSTEQEFSIRLNPEFVTQVTEQFTFDDTLLVMCRSGGRSAVAVNLLAEAGFKNAFTVTDGMEGDMDKHLDADHLLAEAIRKLANLYADRPVERPTGYGYESESVSRARRTKNGWKNSGLPWTYETNPERMILPM
jgi:rhodanese-related sulfurtransferase